jgi:chaperonin GroEL
VDDALQATKAAVEEGILPGGGSAFIHCIATLEKLTESLSGCKKVGAEIIMKAISYPLRQIAENAGEEGSIVVQKVMGMKANEGWNALSGEYGNLVEMGVIDPTKVTRLTLELAASIASLLLTTEAIITDEPSDDKPSPAMAGGGMEY